MIAVTQVRHKHSEGRACFDKRLAEGGKDPQGGLRALKRQVSDAVFTPARIIAAPTAMSCGRSRLAVDPLSPAGETMGMAAV